MHAVDEHHADIDAEFEKLAKENEEFKAAIIAKDKYIATQAKELAELRSALAAASLNAPSLEASRPTTAAAAPRTNGTKNDDDDVAASYTGTNEEHEAASKIQANFRGHLARKDGGDVVAVSVEAEPEVQHMPTDLAGKVSDDQRETHTSMSQ